MYVNDIFISYGLVTGHLNFLSQALETPERTLKRRYMRIDAR